MSVCIVTGSTVAKIATLSFTLAWTHSVQKTRWIEEWRVGPTSLQIVEAWAESNGAGMEPQNGAVFDGKFWRWKPAMGPLPEVALRRSDAVPEGWTFCTKGPQGSQCRAIGTPADTADIAVLKPCPD